VLGQSEVSSRRWNAPDWPNLLYVAAHDTQSGTPTAVGSYKKVPGGVVMHDYSIDTHIRRTVYVVIALIALGVPAYIAEVAAPLNIPDSLKFPLSFGVIFSLMAFLFDRFVWKWLPPLHGVPDLSGRWRATGVSSYQDPQTGENARFSMDIRIRQTFSRIEVFTETADSTSRSFMASIETQHAMQLFRYGFDNIPKNMSNAELQRHPGMMDLRLISGTRMEGDYFSGKHRLRYGSLELDRQGD
jgi:SMODS-associating 2TM, beta-strand rich effector domain